MRLPPIEIIVMSTTKLDILTAEVNMALTFVTNTSDIKDTITKLNNLVDKIPFYISDPIQGDWSNVEELTELKCRLQVGLRTMLQHKDNQQAYIALGNLITSTDIKINPTYNTQNKEWTIECPQNGYHLIVTGTLTECINSTSNHLRTINQENSSNE